ncbi:MAG: hypothetical protein EBU57_04470 [Alphaproteobacteria bacterium]|nr:hypothetical protein [Alphaproteobacteria bacterium]
MGFLCLIGTHTIKCLVFFSISVFHHFSWILIVSSKLSTNHDEITSLYETDSFDDAVGKLVGKVDIAAVTRGADGSVIVTANEVVEVAAEPVEKVVDTTGAGDLYAAGVLYGLTQGYELSVAGRIGSICAAEVISHYGARPEVSLMDLVKEKLG